VRRFSPAGGDYTLRGACDAELTSETKVERANESARCAYEYESARCVLKKGEAGCENPFFDSLPVQRHFAMLPPTCSYLPKLRSISSNWVVAGLKTKGYNHQPRIRAQRKFLNSPPFFPSNSGSCKATFVCLGKRDGLGWLARLALEELPPVRAASRRRTRRQPARL
jgi:hypothetical protein